ncbi:MAG: hypothetical protein V4568_19540 [Pseudomonadota bacterium]
MATILINSGEAAKLVKFMQGPARAPAKGSEVRQVGNDEWRACGSRVGG